MYGCRVVRSICSAQTCNSFPCIFVEAENVANVIWPNELPISWLHIPYKTIVYGTSNGPQNDIGNGLAPCSILHIRPPPLLSLQPLQGEATRPRFGIDCSEPATGALQRRSHTSAARPPSTLNRNTLTHVMKAIHMFSSSVLAQALSFGSRFRV